MLHRNLPEIPLFSRPGTPNLALTWNAYHIQPMVLSCISHLLLHCQLHIRYCRIIPTCRYDPTVPNMEAMLCSERACRHKEVGPICLRSRAHTRLSWQRSVRCPKSPLRNTGTKNNAKTQSPFLCSLGAVPRLYPRLPRAEDGSLPVGLVRDARR